MTKITVAKPQAIILDFMSTAIKAGFIEKGLFAYVRKHGRGIIEQLWARKDFKELVAKVRRQVRRDRRGQDDIPELLEKNASADQQQQALYDNIIWYLDHTKETSAHYKLKFAIYESGYDSGKLQTHVYTDVARNLKVWHEQGIKIFIYSNAWVTAQKMFMKKTNHGPLDNLISGFFDTSEIGEPSESNSFVKLKQQIDLPSNEILFLTKGVQEGRAAKEAGIHAILVISHTHQLKRYDKDDLDAFQRLRSFDELSWGEVEQSPDGSGVADPGASASAGSSEAGSQAGSAVDGSQAGSAVGSQAGSAVGSQAGSAVASGAGSQAGSNVGSAAASGSEDSEETK